MLTVGEHDTMWKDIMGSKIPNIDNNIRILTNQIGHYNQLMIVKELHELKVISDLDYAQSLISLGSGVMLWESENEKQSYLNKATELFK